MKKVFLAVAVLCGVAFSSQAQDFAFKRFRFDLGGGYGLPFTKSLDAGALFYVEPKYEVIPNVAVGLRWEGSLFAGVRNTSNSSSAEVKLSSGWMLTGDYYFFIYGILRTYGGGGLGLFSVAGAKAKVTGLDNNQLIGGSADANVSTNNFGLMLRAGVDVAHWRLGVSYNAAFADEMFHYLGVTVGWYIGGGKK